MLPAPSLSSPSPLSVAIFLTQKFPACLICGATFYYVPLWPYVCLMPDPDAELYKGGLAKQGVMD